MTARVSEPFASSILHSLSFKSASPIMVRQRACESAIRFNACPFLLLWSLIKENIQTRITAIVITSDYYKCLFLIITLPCIYPHFPKIWVIRTENNFHF